MGLLEFVVLCVVVGLIVYLVNTLLPIPQAIKTVIVAVAVVVLVVIFLRALVGDIQIPRLR